MVGYLASVSNSKPPSAPIRTRSRDVEYRYRQDSDFLYLTGFNEHDALLVMVTSEEGGNCSLDSVCGTVQVAQQCDANTDPINGSPWIVCDINQDEAWISANNGGVFNADLICQDLGFDRVGQHGGTAKFVKDNRK